MRPWRRAGALALVWGALVGAPAAGAPAPVVVLPPGDTSGPLVLDHPQTLRGAPGARLVRGPGARGPTLVVASPGVVVEDLVIVGSGEGTRRDHTAVVVTAPGTVVRRVTVVDAWAGLWVEADRVVVDGFTFRGLADFPFWQRGDGVRVVRSRGTRLSGLDLGATLDGVYVDGSADTHLDRVTVADARYAVHLMFSAGGTATALGSHRTTVGFMAMESTDWTVSNAAFQEGYRTGSAGIRLVRTKGLGFDRFVVGRQAAGVELVDARGSRFTAGRVEENAVAWAWGGDNAGTLVTGVVHRGNLADVSASEPRVQDDADAHDHGASALPPSVAPPGVPTRPAFDGNFWDAWKGWDAGDGRGDTPYRFDPETSRRQAAWPWDGVFLGSPWSIVASTLPGGDVLDPRPLVKAPE